MKLQKLLLYGALSLCAYTHTHTHAQQPKWVVGNSVVDPVTATVTPNPIFQGQPDHTQNAIYDENGNVKIYAIVGNIYNANGDQIVTDPYMHFSYPAAYTKEVVVTPLSTACNHEWKVYQKDYLGVWQLLYTDFASAPTFTGLDDPGQVKIEHTIIPHVTTTCNVNLTTTVIIP